MDCSDAISAMQRHPSTVTKEGKQPMTTTTPDLGSSGCAVAPADSDNREKRDESSIVTRAASKALDKTQSPTALGKQAGDALKEEGVLQPDLGALLCPHPLLKTSSHRHPMPHRRPCPSRRASVRQPSSGSSQGSSCARCMARIRASSLQSRQATGYSRDRRQTGQESVTRSARSSDRVGRMWVDGPH